MDDRPGVIISRITKSGFVTSDGQPARIVIFQRKAALFEEFYRVFTQSWIDACLHEDLLLFHTELTAPNCRGLLDYEMWIEDRLLLNNGSVECIQVAYDRINGRHFALKKVPAAHVVQPLLWMSVLLGAWGSLETNVYGLQMKEESREIWLLLRIPEERIPLGQLFKGFLQGTGDFDGIKVNVGMLKRVLAEMYFRMDHFHTTGVSNLSLTVDSVNFFPNRWEFIVDFLNLRDVIFQGQPEFCSGQTRDLQNVNSMIVPYLEKMEMNRCLEDIQQKETHLEIAYVIVNSLTGCNDIQVLNQPSLKYPTQEQENRRLYNGRQPSDIVLRIGDTEIREVDYRSLDLTIPEDECKVIQTFEPQFRKGCLSDGVMICFFMSLRKEVHPAVPVIVLTTNKLKRPVDELQEEITVDIQVGVRWILAPWNPEFHWILIAVDMKERKLYYLDPDPRVSQRHQDQKVLDKVISLLKWKPDIIRDIPDCSKQGYEDNNSCGVFVCFYAEQLICGNSLGESVDTQKMRSHIRGKLLKYADYVHPSRAT